MSDKVKKQPGKQTPAAFVIGHPIAHSRSPLLHGFWLETHGISGSYTAIDVAPDEIADFTARIREGEFVGGNVTLPHKQAVFALADKVHDDAKVLGAANTLWMENGKLCATNTDTYGFLANLDSKANSNDEKWDDDATNQQVLVIGAGGAARAVVHGLVSRGFQKVLVANRTLSRAEELGRHFDRTEAITLDAMASVVGECRLVANTTSLGMERRGEPSETPTCFPTFLDNAAATCLVTDIVYTPLETPLLAYAKRRGLKSVDGLGMLLHQAVPGFERWFGVRPEVSEELRNHVLASMGLGPNKGDA